MTLSMGKHTPTPWRIEEDGPDYSVVGPGPNDFIMCDTCFYPSAPTRSDAEFIVHAVNNHEALVAMVDQLQGLISEDDDSLHGLKTEARKLLATLE